MTDNDETSPRGDRESRVAAGRPAETARAAIRVAIERAAGTGALDADAVATVSAELERQPDDVVALHTWQWKNWPALRLQFCSYPGCFEAPRPATGPGKPPAYCSVVLDDRGEPAHTAVRSMRERNRLKSGGRPGSSTTPQVPADPSGERPVSWARTSVPDMVARVEQVVADQQAVTIRALGELQSTIALLGDDEARAAEIESLQHDMNTQVEDAARARLAAQNQARTSRTAEEAARAAEQEAVDAATEAADRADRVEAEAIEQARVDQERIYDAEQAEQRAQTELERVLRETSRQVEAAGVEAAAQVEAARAEANEKVTAAQEAAKAHEQQVIADRDAVLATREREAAAKIAAAEAAAQQARDDRDQQVRQAEQSAARDQQAAQEARDARDRLQQEVDQLRTQVQADAEAYRGELDVLRTKHENTVERLTDKFEADRSAQAERLRVVGEQATKAREELATVTAQRETERAVYERETAAAEQRLADQRDQSARDTEQRLADLRAVYDRQVEGLRGQLAAATDEGKTNRT